MRTNEEKRGGLLRTEAAALQGINTQIEQTKQAYGQAFQTELAQAENTLAQRDTDTMQQWLSTSYFMSGPQREGERMGGISEYRAWAHCTEGLSCCRRADDAGRI